MAMPRREAPRLFDLGGLSDESVRELHSFLEYLRQRDRKDSRLLLSDLPQDVLARATEFLSAADLIRLSQTCAALHEAAAHGMRALGERCFRGILVEERSFGEATEVYGVRGAFGQFLGCFAFSDHELVSTVERPDELRLEISDESFHSFTVPLAFAVSREAELFLDFATEIHFGPEVIRSVVGVVDSLENLHVDRAMVDASQYGFAMAFGPLSGVVSRDGKFFDRFETFATSAFIRDFLASATVDTVGLRIGIYFCQGRVAFFRLAEEDSDWESTGFVYEMEESQKFLYPCLMFSRVSQTEDVLFHLRGISDCPPFVPHVNEEALDFENNWLPFEDETLDILREGTTTNTPRDQPEQPDHPHPLDEVLELREALEQLNIRRSAVVDDLFRPYPGLLMRRDSSDEVSVSSDDL